MITNKYLFNISSYYIDRAIKNIYWKNYVGNKDFDDIKQDIIIHIFNKKNKFDHSKPIKPWVKTIIHHQLKNKIRDKFTSSRKTGEIKFGYKAPILTKIKQNNLSINEEIIYEPDMVSEKENEINLDEFIKYLNRNEIILYNTIKTCNTISSAARKLRWNRCVAYKILNRIRSKAKNFLNDVDAIT